MIDLYAWAMPNERKASIMLEEVGLPYAVHRVNIGRQEQFDPAFVAISPNSKIPAIVDNDAPSGPLSMFESGAVLIYLAEKTGKLLASEGAGRHKALEWLSWQLGGIGAIFGKLGFFAIRSTEKSALAIERFTEESRLLLRVLDRRLQESRISRETIIRSPISSAIPGRSPARPISSRCSGRSSRRCRRSTAG